MGVVKEGLQLVEKEPATP
ncbi:hypothetical protein Godav_013917 [Gossypium davidsonii]|uniref:Uncharacterized protein n=1 Tax=Gossypium davidsonii TaxID=34287 RepID=A0A7J8RI12_GOSDV|nr:hypothetical protein [Gossypium davidsonii]